MIKLTQFINGVWATILKYAVCIKFLLRLQQSFQ